MYDRKGLCHFPNQGWSRIGLPLLIFALAVHGPVGYLLAGRPPPATFIGSLYESGWFLVYLHLVPRKLAALLLVLRDLSAVCHPRQVRPLVLAAAVTQQSWRSVRRNMIDELALRLAHGEYR